MTPERWRQIEAVYHAALECEPQMREAHVEEKCGGDESLLREVKSLLARDASNPNAFLDGDRNICADTTATPIPNHGYGISPDGTAQGAACEFPRNYKSIQNLGFGPKMHHSTGNVGLADGSVQQFSQSGFVAGLRTSAAATTNIAAQNYLLFP